jgi:hypothetical protein
MIIQSVDIVTDGEHGFEQADGVEQARIKGADAGVVAVHELSVDPRGHGFTSVARLA